MGTGQAIGTHRCNAMETGIGAGGPACILHMGRGLGHAKSETGLPR